ncbi:MAG: efflux RND transporter periplasmic adaptor subunit [Myxococcales bacterium]|nr:efflux RND transporter periplasmic adaptor subunit [Myxococcales bacterium]
MTTEPPAPHVDPDAPPARPATIDPPAPTPPGASPRRGYGLGTMLVFGLVCAIGAGAAAIKLLDHGAPSATTGGAAGHQYHCPMHPTIVSDHPGECPICGMDLVEVDAASTTAATTPSVRTIVHYRSPMDPRQTSPTPRKDEMGMAYLPVYADELAGGSSPVPGMGAVDIDPDRQQLIGLRTTEVTRASIGGEVRTVGRVAIDETRVSHVNVKNGGFVERIFVDYLGKPVKRGDPLFTLFSPELVAAQEEYLLAVRTRGVLGASGDGQGLVDAARRRLALWDVSAAELKRLEATGTPRKALTFYAPATGVVTKKDVVAGMKLDPGAMPYELVDLSEVWVIADVYESEIRFVHEGTPATLAMTAYPDRTFAGTISFIAPFLDPSTRTIKVRLKFANPDGDLRPEMYGEVVLSTTARDALVVPHDAIIDSGAIQVVFVAQGAGKFVPRQVQLGQRDATRVEVVAGLEAGERVVTRANFLVDSESRLRASLEGLTPAPAPTQARVLPEAGAVP